MATQHSISKAKPVKICDRPRRSIYPMISVSAALDCIFRETDVPRHTSIHFKDCFSHILAEDIVAKEPYPPFNASIKDGYAVLANDDTTIREVIGSVTPGCKLDFPLERGTCVRVSTGSAIPDKADAVIQVEDTLVVEHDHLGNELAIEILKQPGKVFHDIRTVGSDVSKGEVLIPKHHKITSAEIGIMAMCGIEKPVVYQKPCVALLSTGDEIVEPGALLAPGCIRDSNKSTLLCALQENRIPVVDVGIAKDVADDIKAHLTQAFEEADIVVTTGGVSMGERDMLKQVLEADFDAVVHFGRIHMKPGKPTTFSTALYNNRKKLIFGLPGNPVSAFVCFYLFVLPCIKQQMGYREPNHSLIKVQLSHDIQLDERPEYYRVSLKYNEDGLLIANGTGGQQSSRLLSMQNADALLVLPPKTPELSTIKAYSKVVAICLLPI